MPKKTIDGRRVRWRVVLLQASDFFRLGYNVERANGAGD